MEPILHLNHIKKHYPIDRGLFKKPDILKAIDGVSLEVYPGETLSLVGESGCGKSTVGRMILQIEPLTEGSVNFHGEEISKFTPRALRNYWQKVQIIFQNPYSSLNPRWKVGQIIGEPLQLNTTLTKGEIETKVQSILDKVGLLPEHYYRYPHQFSGGQRQRIGVARALALEPEVVVCDEPVSALDVSVQSQVLNLLLDLQEEESRQLTYVFISHDLSVVEHISDRIAVMYLGKIVETGRTKDIFDTPQHPYTKALLSAIPTLEGDKKRDPIILTGDIPSPIDPPSGCSFRTRCPFAKDECASVEMKLEEKGEKHFSACPFPV